MRRLVFALIVVAVVSCVASFVNSGSSSDSEEYHVTQIHRPVNPDSRLY